MRYFLVERSEIAGNRSVITGSDARHIKNVLRLKPGDGIGLFDGQGLVYEARIENITSEDVTVSIVSRFPSRAEPTVHLTVAQAFLKDKKMDVLVRQLTELGINRWIPFTATRSVPRPGTKSILTRTERWQRIAREAIKQCKRGRVPEIGAATTFEALLETEKVYDLKVVFWEGETRPMDPRRVAVSRRHIRDILLAVGPEGGFTSEEIELARANGFVAASLGPRILRAETAAVAACTLVQYLFGDMGPQHLGKNA